MKIVVGLGNPGRQYEATRHNVGWMVLDRIADRAGWGGRARARDAAAVVRGRYRDLDLVLVKPTTYMNLSGLAVRKVLARERAPLDDLLVVVDDFALPLGRLRLREEGSAGGHNGLRSIITEMGTQRFARLRVGIGEPSRDAVDHVLSRFAPGEQADLGRVLDVAADAVEEWARFGAPRAANRWNAWTLPSLDAPVATALEARDRVMPPDEARDLAAPRDVVSRAPTRDAVSRATIRDAASRAPTRDADAGPVAPGAGPAVPDPEGIVRHRTGWRRLLPRAPSKGSDR